MTDAKRPESALLKADPKAILTFEAQKDGKLRVTYQGWLEAVVLYPGQHLEVVARNGQVQAFRRGEPLTGPAPDAYRDWDGTDPVEPGENAIETLRPAIMRDVPRDRVPGAGR